MQHNKRNQAGFSAIEAMIVLGVLAVMVTLVVPQFEMFQAKAKQAEATTNLEFLHSLQQGYHVEFGKYSKLNIQGRIGEKVSCGINELGFELDPCDSKHVRYGYLVTEVSKDNFEAIAITGTGENNLVANGCAIPDVWTINEKRQVKSKFNALELCK